MMPMIVDFILKYPRWMMSLQSHKYMRIPQKFPYFGYMNAKLKFFLVIGCLFFAMSDLTFGQAPGPLSTQSKRAAKAYFEAMDLFEKRLYERVLDKLTKATEEDSNFVEAWLMMGDVASYMKDDNKAIICYRKAIKIDPDFFPNAGYILGKDVIRRFFV